MLNVLNFEEIQMKPLFCGLITQTIIPFNDITMNISEGDVFGISFNNVFFKNYSLIITNISFTNMKKITNEDICKNGFLYFDDTIVKLDFELVKKEANE